MPTRIKKKRKKECESDNDGERIKLKFVRYNGRKSSMI